MGMVDVDETDLVADLGLEAGLEAGEGEATVGAVAAALVHSRAQDHGHVHDEGVTKRRKKTRGAVAVVVVEGVELAAQLQMAPTHLVEIGMMGVQTLSKFVDVCSNIKVSVVIEERTLHHR